MIEESDVNWWIYRPVVRKIESLETILYEYTIDRLLELHEAMNLRRRIDARVNEYQRNQYDAGR